ncbi:Copper transport protein ctr4 [Cytospora mali]|uniref:Copper transport protein n=1 Tax=Cytospora mali TaxID=578113 RepID=A0A194W2P0_CYTMA|nr:Copper transport protein ctr4 [Valsa mali]
MDMSAMTGMDHGSMSMGGMTMVTSSTTMATSTTGMVMDISSTATATGNMHMATATGTMDSMGMSHIVGSAGRVCKIQMLWNWNTIGACFITPQWQVASRGGMVGSCFGVVFLVIALEMLRRAAKEFDRWIIRRHNHKQATAPAGASHGQIPPADPTRAADQSVSAAAAPAGPGVAGGVDGAVSRKSGSTATASDVSGAGDAASVRDEKRPGRVAPGGDFGVARLAMNYNGYIIISIIVGAYMGFFLFSWEALSQGTRSNTSAGDEATLCCL